MDELKTKFNGGNEMIKGVEYRPLYRGKTENGEWIESACIMQFNPHPMSGKDEIHLWWAGHGWTKIAMDTFGVYIGVNDKKGNKIFSDDIVRGMITCSDEEEDNARILYEVGGVCYWVNDTSFRENIYDRDYGIDLSEFEVIGNIHDNKNLWRALEWED